LGLKKLLFELNLLVSLYFRIFAKKNLHDLYTTNVEGLTRESSKKLMDEKNAFLCEWDVFVTIYCLEFECMVLWGLISFGSLEEIKKFKKMRFWGCKGPEILELLGM